MTIFDFAAFKQSIHLGQFAASHGYQMGKTKSTRASLAMRHADGDKIIISKKGASWVYFSVFDDQDNGTIIDFVKNRTGKNWQEIGKQLAEWTGSAGMLPVCNLPDAREQVYNRTRIQKAFGWLTPAGRHPYLTNDRKIPGQVLSHPRFQRRIFQDRYGNVVFPHWDGQGVCGLELKNQDKGVFMRGSEKALWLSHIHPADTVLTIAESTIDALSHFTLFSPADTAYAAVSGGMRGKQLDVLISVMNGMPLLEKIILAVDNDAGGDKIAGRIENYLAGKFTGQVIRHIPGQPGTDWNNVLKAVSLAAT